MKRGGKLPWAEVDAWRKELHLDFERALAETKPVQGARYREKLEQMTGC